MRTSGPSSRLLAKLWLGVLAAISAATVAGGFLPGHAMAAGELIKWKCAYRDNGGVIWELVGLDLTRAECQGFQSTTYNTVPYHGNDPGDPYCAFQVRGMARQMWIRSHSRNNGRYACTYFGARLAKSFGYRTWPTDRPAW
jgi:hypothetical protein